ncbi:MAG: hypothetical protein J0I49_01870 [Pseudonocardia sp.]|nr:hypothetical protein [Pseudonocardia sp.]
MDTSPRAPAPRRAPRSVPPVDEAAPRPPDRLGYLWLVVAAGLFLFVGGRWNIAWAAWLAPLLLLRFVHGRRAVPGLLLAWLARAVVFAVLLPPILYPPGTAPGGAVPYVVAVLVGGLATVPYVADRLIAPRLRGVAATLVFPAALTGLEYLGSLGPFGAITSTAYTQYGYLPLMQLASVTGIWGITFVVAWFASVLAWVWRHGFAWPAARTPVLVSVVVVSVILLGGGARLALAPPDAPTVRVAGISASRAAAAALHQQLPAATLSALAAGTASPADRARARAAFATLDDGLLTDSAEQARGGARIVVWPETSPTGAAVLQEDEPALLQRAAAVARQGNTYLDLGLAVFLTGPVAGPFARDEAVLIDPTGRVVWTYQKTHPTPADQGVFVVGDGKVPVTDSPYGRLANVICFDMDYSGMIRQAGQSRADVMLAPADDWPAIDPSHTYVSVPGDRVRLFLGPSGQPGARDGRRLRGPRARRRRLLHHRSTGDRRRAADPRGAHRLRRGRGRVRVAVPRRPGGSRRAGRPAAAPGAGPRSDSPDRLRGPAYGPVPHRGPRRPAGVARCLSSPRVGRPRRCARVAGTSGNPISGRDLVLRTLPITSLRWEAHHDHDRSGCRGDRRGRLRAGLADAGQGGERSAAARAAGGADRDRWPAGARRSPARDDGDRARATRHRRGGVGAAGGGPGRDGGGVGTGGPGVAALPAADLGAVGGHDHRPARHDRTGLRGRGGAGRRRSGAAAVCRGDPPR